MYLSAKKIKYADLVVPFTKCPFKNVEHDCPFVVYWEMKSVEKQIEIIEDLPEERIIFLREQHKNCQERKAKEVQKLCKSRSFIGASCKDLIFDIL
jgi:hypothetical protein